MPEYEKIVSWTWRPHINLPRVEGAYFFDGVNVIISPVGYVTDTDDRRPAALMRERLARAAANRTLRPESQGLLDFLNVRLGE